MWSDGLLNPPQWFSYYFNEAAVDAFYNIPMHKTLHVAFVSTDVDVDAIESVIFVMYNQ